MASLISTLCIFFFLLNISLNPVVGEVIFEDGYSVSTVIDGNKIKVNPHSIIHVSGGFIILDSSASTFYTLSFNKDSDFSVKKLTGTGVGYADGSLDEAKFNKPKSFAVDSKGNIYVADMKNMHAIRKISKSGVTTIAGGYSKTAGRADGPGLNASFSDDYELSFIPERCTLMISDHGNRLVREILLKAEDCSRDSHSGDLRAVSTWFLTVGLPCLVCLVIGLVIRPYVIPNDHSSRLQRNMTWKHFLISLERQVLMFWFGIRSVVVDSNSYSLLRKLVLLSFSHLRLMFSPKVVVCQTSRRQPAPLINFHDCESKESANSPVVAYSFEDLITFDGSLDNSELTANQDDAVKESTDVSVVDNMILANIKVFAEQGSASSGPEISPSILSLVNQKKKVVW